MNLHPTLIIPPIPEKHTMADYAAKPTKAKEDASIIELRKRMLSVFLNRCRKMKEIRDDGVWWRFLDPNASWVSCLSFAPLIGEQCSLLPFIVINRQFCRLRCCTHTLHRRSLRITSRPLHSTQQTPLPLTIGFLCLQLPQSSRQGAPQSTIQITRQEACLRSSIVSLHPPGT